MARPLTDRQMRFVEEYLVDLCATAAYQRAGYKVTDNAARAAASRLLANVNIQDAIRRAKAERSERTQVTQDRVVRELFRVGLSDVRKLFRGDGTLKPVAELDDDTAAAVSSVETFEEFEGRGDDRRPAGTTRKVRLWDKVAALEKLLRHLGGGEGPAPAPPALARATVPLEQFRQLPVEEMTRLLCGPANWRA